MVARGLARRPRGLRPSGRIEPGGGSLLFKVCGSSGLQIRTLQLAARRSLTKEIELRSRSGKGGAFPRSRAAEPLDTSPGRGKGNSRSALPDPLAGPRRGRCPGHSAARTSRPPRRSPDTPPLRPSVVLRAHVKISVASGQVRPAATTPHSARDGW
jgi:hypothetical protein